MSLFVKVVYGVEKLIVKTDALISFRKPEVYVFNYKKFKFWIRKNTFDKQIIREVLSLNPYDIEIKSDFTVVDLGSNIGAFTVPASRKAKKVIAYEPDSENFSLLKKNIELNNCKNVVLHNLAVTNKNGSSKMYTSPINPGRNSLFQGFDSKRELKNVKTISLGQVFKDNNLKSIDLLKADVEGSEHLIFNGNSKEVIQKIKRIEMEYSNYPNSKNHGHLIKFFEENGFKVKVKRTFLFDWSPMGIIIAQK